MADNFGPQQPRVLNTADRSLDNVVFQYRKPPLTSEWNLINQISNEKVQDISRASYPSGWMTVGEILQDWDDADVATGQVNCSASYDTNSFKLFSKSDNVAVVNGWPIVIQGTSSPDSNNIIRLSAPGGQLYDFVFLEVWRKLVGSSDSIYPYGNVLTNPFPDNEIEWPAIGTETTKRVQIQYRVRVAPINSPVDPTSDGFDIDPIYPIGGRIAGEYPYPAYPFRKYGVSDIGLYISGDGSSGDQTILNTVDGYVYAIPMFMICRRQKWDTVFTASTMRRTYVDKSAQVTGYVLDRPDKTLADVIYKDDIVDFRHQILSSGKDVESLVDQTVSRLIAGELTTAVKRGFGEDGDTSTTASIGGGTLTKVECLNTSADIPVIGTGSNTTPTAFKRRAFCNAEYTHDHNVIEIPHTGTWLLGDTFDPTALLTLPDGDIVSVDGFYNTTVGPVTGITPSTPRAPTVFTVGAGSNIIGQSSLLMEFTFRYDSSSAGFKDVPREFLEAGKGTYQQIATRDNDVLLRFNNGESLLNFGLNPGPGDPGETDSRDFLRYKGGNYTEKSNFGHEMVIYRTTNVSGIVTINLDDSLYSGYHILGIKSVEPETSPGSGVYDSPVYFSAQRNVHTSPFYGIDSYNITASAYTNTNVRIVLYTGSKAPEDVGDYSVGDSLKFFELSKQGRGVIDTYEVLELVGTEIGATGTFWVDSGDKPIIALLTTVDTVSGYVEGTPFAWRFDSDNVFVNISAPLNSDLPVLDSSAYTANLLPTKIKVTAISATGWGKIRVPVLVHSYVTQAETPYNFFYKTNAYQGLLDSTIRYYGKIVKEGPALITTLGSGAVTNYMYADEPTLSIPTVGKAVFSSGSRLVIGSVDSGGNLPQWLAYARSGDYIRVSSSSQSYRILSVGSDTALTLAEVFVGAGGIPVAYEIFRIDVPHNNISNVVDRLPALNIIALSSQDLVDYKCYSDIDISTSVPFRGMSITEPRQKMQDPMNTLSNDFILGTSGTGKRGRNNFILTLGKNNIFKLSDTPRPYVVYDYVASFNDPGHNRKIYQMYLFNQSSLGVISGEADLTGRLYLMVVSGETKPVDPNETSLNGFFDRDTVDIYEIVGRPIVKMR